MKAIQEVQRQSLIAAGWVLVATTQDAKIVRSYGQSTPRDPDLGAFVVDTVSYSLVYGFAHANTGRVWTVTVLVSSVDYAIDPSDGKRTGRHAVRERLAATEWGTSATKALADAEAWGELFKKLSSE